MEYGGGPTKTTTAYSTPGSSWCVQGAYAKHDGRIGKVTMDPDSDNDMKLRWPDEETSIYIKVSRLMQSEDPEEGDFFRKRDDDTEGRGIVSV